MMKAIVTGFAMVIVLGFIITLGAGITVLIGKMLSGKRKNTRRKLVNERKKAL